MNKATGVLLAMLSVVLGGCPSTGVRTTTTVYTTPAYTHHHEPVREQVVTKTTTVETERHGGTVVKETTTVETERHGGTVVKKTTVVVRKRAVDCSDRNPYRDEYNKNSPCYWKHNLH
jgi:hypothetical protein